MALAAGLVVSAQTQQARNRTGKSLPGRLEFMLTVNFNFQGFFPHNEVKG